MITGIYNHACIHYHDCVTFGCLLWWWRNINLFNCCTHCIAWMSFLPRIYNVNITLHKRSSVCAFEKECGWAPSSLQADVVCKRQVRTCLCKALSRKVLCWYLSLWGLINYSKLGWLLFVYSLSVNFHVIFDIFQTGHELDTSSGFTLPEEEQKNSTLLSKKPKFLMAANL